MLENAEELQEMLTDLNAESKPQQQKSYSKCKN